VYIVRCIDIVFQRSLYGLYYYWVTFDHCWTCTECLRSINWSLIGYCSELLFVSHFWPLLKRVIFFEAAGAVEKKIGSSFKSNFRSLKLVKIRILTVYMCVCVCVSEQVNELGRACMCSLLLFVCVRMLRLLPHLRVKLITMATPVLRI